MSFLMYHDLKPKDVLFQQDNDSKHTSKRAQSWFRQGNELQQSQDISQELLASAPEYH
ncbi:hypothetical protein BOTBODRAFT_178887 [Botryobasidium botryosum FD-172 SS1]|uniref:Tc1-like transposase DDE domain-containing protein n=1 Tax=Botryobasidium botryosum (strain FD-172 SS1) TaxID=930990 RepID=A0A067M4N1_BOTB1|nr:hypothetical protein BOTBODRAFT_178887 [Botryobasidium botryosum FD-172 SS1]